MNIYSGTYDPEKWFQVFKNGEPFNHEPSLKVRNHSPTGFAWAYRGSGPAQLALAILLEETLEEEAEQWYQAFKAEVIARLPQEREWTLRSEDVQAWLAKKRGKNSTQGDNHHVR